MPEVQTNISTRVTHRHQLALNYIDAYTEVCPTALVVAAAQFCKKPFHIAHRLAQWPRRFNVDPDKRSCAYQSNPKWLINRVTEQVPRLMPHVSSLRRWGCSNSVNNSGSLMLEMTLGACIHRPGYWRFR